MLTGLGAPKKRRPADRSGRPGAAPAGSNRCRVDDPRKGGFRESGQAVDLAPSTGMSRAPLACIKETLGRSGLFTRRGR